jgi:hypothetical protein
MGAELIADREAVAWHGRSPEDVCEELGVDPSVGLD